MLADNSRHLRAAARRRSEQTRKQAIKALRRLDGDGTPIAFDAVARRGRLPPVALSERRHPRRDRTASTSPPVCNTHVISPETGSGHLTPRCSAGSKPPPKRIRRLEQDNRELREALAAGLGEKRHARVIGSPARRDTPGKSHGAILGPC